MFNSPVLWSTDYQLTARHGFVFKGRTIGSIRNAKDAFITSKDSMDLYNQTKGKHTIGFFKDNDPHKLFVDGNGVTYVIKDEFEKVFHKHSWLQSNNIYIEDKQIDRISFSINPTLLFTPLRNCYQNETLDGF